MPNMPFTPRNVTKFVAKAAVAGYTAKFTANTVSDHTRFEEDDTLVDIGSTVVGWYVSEKLKPITDKVVDVTFDFVATQRAKHQDKKSAE